ncbi:type-1 angiotensin II receptor B-like [Ciona intestinalis]
MNDSNSTSSFVFTTTHMMTTQTPYVKPFNEVGVVVSAVIILTLMVFGLIGNSLTIAVILSYRALSNNVFMRFILSLCVSDLISALISWIFLYRRTWGFDDFYPIPGVFCKFYWSADIMTSYVTALHVLSFAILRYISVKFPIFYNKIRIKHGNIWIACLWLAGFAGGFMPSVFIFGAKKRDRTTLSPDARWPACTINFHYIEIYKLYQSITFPMFLYVPTVGVVVACFLIGFTVKSKALMASTDVSRARKEKQAVLQLTLIVVSFLFGYIPFTAYEFWSAQTHPNTEYYRVVDYWFGMIEYMFLRFSECMNPVFYNLGSEKVRRYTKTFLKYRVFTCKNWDSTSSTEGVTAGERSTTTAGANLGV